MQGFLCSCPPGAGQGHAPLTPGPIVVAYEPLASDHGLNFIQEQFEVPDGPGRGSWEAAWVL